MKGKPVTHLRLLYAACLGVFSAGLGFAAVTASSQTASRAQFLVRMPQGAFLRKPSADVNALVTQVRSDHAVAVRYARLFHLPVTMVPLAFEQLKLKTLTTDHIMQVHFVKMGKDNKELLVYKPRRVKAGTSVYCMPDGTPLLVRVCGNPIRKKVIMPESVSAAPVPDFDASETDISRPTADSSVAENTPTRLILPPLTPLPVIPVVEAENVLPPALLPIAPALAPADLKVASLPPVYSWLHGPSGLFGLAALPALIPFINTGGGSGGGTPPITPPIITPPGNNTPTGVVPEPSVIAVAITALLGTGLIVRRRFVKR